MKKLTGWQNTSKPISLKLKQIIEKTPLYHPLRNRRINKVQLNKLAQWNNLGKPIPPPDIVKQQTLLNYSKLFGLTILIETGTFYGDMLNALKDDFDYIYSIELSEELYNKAKRRFKAEKNIELIHGDSSIELEKIMNKIHQPALFWLDAHYSYGVTVKGEKETPILEELNIILTTQEYRHVIIIDDVRCFGTWPYYPSISILKNFIKSKVANINIIIQDDMLRITPKQL